MARPDTIECAAGAWTELTEDADGTIFTVQVQSGAGLIKRGSSAPSAGDPGLRLRLDEGFSNKAIGDVFHGDTGARLYFFAETDGAVVYCDHD